MDFELEDIYEELIKTLPGMAGESDPLIRELKSPTWWRRKQAVESKEAKLNHVLMGIKDKDFRVAAAAARSPLLEPEMLSAVVKHPDGRVRKEALKNPRIPPEYIDQALANSDFTPADASGLLHNPSLNHQQLMAISSRFHDELNQGYGSLAGAQVRIFDHPGFDNTALNQIALDALANNDAHTLSRLSHSPHLSPEVIHQIIAKGWLQDPKSGRTDSDHLRDLLDNPNLTPDHTLAMLQHDKVPEGVKSDMLRVTDGPRQKLDSRHAEWLFNPPTQDEAYRRAAFTSYRIRDLAAHKDFFSPELASKILNNPYLESHRKAWVLPHADPNEVLAIANGSQDGDVRKAAIDRVFNDETAEFSPEIKQQLSSSLIRDSDPDVAGLGFNKWTPQGDLDWYIRNRPLDFSYVMMEKAIGNKNTPPDVLRWAAQHESPSIRRMVAEEGRNLSPDAISGLLRDPEKVVRNTALTEQPLSEPDMLYALQSDAFDTGHQRTMLRASQLSPAVFHAALSSPHSDVASAVAHREDLPEEIAYQHLDRPDLLPNTRDALLTNNRLTLRPKDLDSMLASDDSSLVSTALEHHSIEADALRNFIETERSKEHHRDYLINRAEDSLMTLDPDSEYEPVKVRYGTGKLRKIRDQILKTGKEDLSPKMIGNLPGGVDWNQMRLPNGNISAKKIQAYIDALPASQFNTSHHPEGWNGAQRHSQDKQSVFQLNMSSDMVSKIKQAGVYQTWKKLSREYAGHPVNPNTVGWVRYTGDPKEGIFIDEVQSDLANSPHAKAAAAVKQSYRGGDPEELERRLKDVLAGTESSYGPEHNYNTMMRIIFGNKHPHEALHEAFAQHLRDKGHAGTKIAVHSLATKAPLSGWDSDRPAPVHGKIAYEDHPKKMGFEPATYNRENMPNMKGGTDGPAQGDPVWQDELRKYEKLKEAVRKLVLAKIEASDGSQEN
jgi:hypothetical protein